MGETLATASCEVWSRRRFAVGGGTEDSEGRLAVGRVETVVELEVVLDATFRPEMASWISLRRCSRPLSDLTRSCGVAGGIFSLLCPKGLLSETTFSVSASRMALSRCSVPARVLGLFIVGGWVSASPF